MRNKKTTQELINSMEELKMLDLNTILFRTFERQVYDLTKFETETKVISYQDNKLELETIVTIFESSYKVLSTQDNVSKDDFEELELYQFIDITDKDVFQIELPISIIEKSINELREVTQC